MRCRRKIVGFTLIEMLICLAIVALLMAVFAPALSGSRDKVRLAASAHDLAITLRETRDLALARSRPEAFAFDASKRAYHSGDAAPHTVDRDITVQLVAADADARGGVIRFFADGGSSGGIFRLTLEKRKLDVVVDWLTGRVSVSEPSR